MSAARWYGAGVRWCGTGVQGTALRLAALATASVGAAWVHENHDPGVLCPLRRLTGVPCPFCGSTTVFMEAGAGHAAAAFAVNPFTVVAAAGLVLVPVGAERWWTAIPRRTRQAILLAAAAGSWLWQLHRFGFLP